MTLTLQMGDNTRHLDIKRIRDRIFGLREYCSISDNYDIIDDRTSDFTRCDCQDICDCELLQLTDLLVGSFRTLLGTTTNDIHRDIAYPVKQIIDRYNMGYA